MPYFAIIAFVIIAGCGGGGSTTPAVVPSAAPTSVPIGPSPTTVTLTGGGYTLSFLLPAITSGSASMGVATLQVGLPSGVTAPSAARPVGSEIARGTGSLPRSPSSLGTSITSLVYLTLVPSADFTIGMTPSFTYTLPTGITLPPGSTSYVLFYDPTQSSTGWVPVLGPGTVNGPTISFAGVNSTVSFKAGQQYVYALIVASQAVPTASPKPTPSGAPTPLPTSPPPTAPPSSSFCPAPPANTFPMHFSNTTGIGGPITLWVAGFNTTSTGFIYLTSVTSGVTQALPASGPVPSLTLPANGCINLPPIVSARIYVALGGNTLDITSNGPSAASGGVGAPAPWNVNASVNNVNTVYDLLEYSWTGSGAMNMDVTQVDAIGIPISFNAINTSGNPAPTALYGMKPNAISNLIADLRTLGTPWTGLIQATGTAGISRVISPQHAANIPPDGGTVPAPPANSPTMDATFYDSIISTIWSTYTGSNFLQMSYPQFPSPAYGLVDPNTKLFNFYTAPSTTSTFLGAVPYPTTWDVFNNAGAFVTATGTYGIYLGRALVVNIERGTLPLPAGAPTGAQPFCGTSDWYYFYGAAATNYGYTPTPGLKTNWYSALMHKYGQAPIAGLPGLAYAFPDDDECQLPGGNGLYDPDFSQAYTTGEQWNVTLNPF